MLIWCLFPEEKQVESKQIILPCTKMKLCICSASSEAEVLWIYGDISQPSGLSSRFLRGLKAAGAADCILSVASADSCGAAEWCLFQQGAWAVGQSLLSVTGLLFGLLPLIKNFVCPEKVARDCFKGIT